VKFDTSNVEFSEKDIKNHIRIPKHLTPELAYLIGVHVGDGCMTFDKEKNDRYISYTGHIIDEREFHQTIIKNAFEILFNKETKITFDRRENHSCIRTYLRSKAIFTFFNKIIKIPVGSKRDIDVPDIIKNSDTMIKREFLRGLADTDFSLALKKRYRQKHYYPTISFSSQSKYLVRTVKNFLSELGFKSSTSYNLKSVRNGKIHTINHVNIYGKRNLSLWFNEIGFNSTKHLTKYEVWKKFGFCPPNTDITERRKILKGEIDVNSYYHGPIA
jgi:hypothetical protein